MKTKSVETRKTNEFTTIAEEREFEEVKNLILKRMRELEKEGIVFNFKRSK